MSFRSLRAFVLFFFFSRSLTSWTGMLEMGGASTSGRPRGNIRFRTAGPSSPAVEKCDTAQHGVTRWSARPESPCRKRASAPSSLPPTMDRAPQSSGAGPRPTVSLPAPAKSPSGVADPRYVIQGQIIPTPLGVAGARRALRSWRSTSVRVVRTWDVRGGTFDGENAAATGLYRWRVFVNNDARAREGFPPDA